MTGDNEKLNPQITHTEIGVRNLRNITIYPLSMAAELKLSDLITKVLQAVSKAQDQEDLEFVSVIVDLIKDNLGAMIEMVTDNEKGETILSEITNLQAVELAEIIYDINFAGAIKKAIGLFEKVRSIGSPAERSLPQSVNNTVDTGSNTSTEESTPKEA